MTDLAPPCTSRFCHALCKCACSPSNGTITTPRLTAGVAVACPVPVGADDWPWPVHAKAVLGHASALSSDGNGIVVLAMVGVSTSNACNAQVEEVGVKPADVELDVLPPPAPPEVAKKRWLVPFYRHACTSRPVASYIHGVVALGTKDDTLEGVPFESLKNVPATEIRGRQALLAGALKSGSAGIIYPGCTVGIDHAKLYAWAEKKVEVSSMKKPHKVTFTAKIAAAKVAGHTKSTWVVVGAWTSVVLVAPFVVGGSPETVPGFFPHSVDDVDGCFVLAWASVLPLELFAGVGDIRRAELTKSSSNEGEAGVTEALSEPPPAMIRAACRLQPSVYTVSLLTCRHVACGAVHCQRTRSCTSFQLR
jgi:hypothetical protein